MSQGIRRVVTGLDEQGKSAVLFDDRTQGSNSRIIWQTPAIPADNSGRDDAGAIDFTLDLLRSPGSTFLLTRMEPGEPYMHATDTLDYFVVLEGRVRMQLEAQSVEIGPGDCIVNRGVVHGWQVLGDEPLVMARVMLPAAPVGAGATV